MFSVLSTILVWQTGLENNMIQSSTLIQSSTATISVTTLKQASIFHPIWCQPISTEPLVSRTIAALCQYYDTSKWQSMQMLFDMTRAWIGQIELHREDSNPCNIGLALVWYSISKRISIKFCCKRFNKSFWWETPCLSMTKPSRISTLLGTLWICIPLEQVFGRGFDSRIGSVPIRSTGPCDRWPGASRNVGCARAWHPTAV